MIAYLTFGLTSPFDAGMYQLAMMFEIVPRLTNAYRIKKDFLSVIRSKSATESKKALAD